MNTEVLAKVLTLLVVVMAFNIAMLVVLLVSLVRLI